MEDPQLASSGFPQINHVANMRMARTILDMLFACNIAARSYIYLTGICQIIYKLGYVFKGGGQRWFHKISCTPVEPRGFRWKDSPASLVFACCLVILYIFQPIPSRLSLFSLVTISSCFVATIGFVLKKSSCCLVISWSNGCRA